MRALTLKQPWLYAIEHLGKRVENRTWKIPYALQCQWIALHAGKSKDKHEWEAVEIIHGEKINIPVPLGAITAVAKFSCVVALDSIDLSDPDDIRKWAFGPYVWMIGDLALLEFPIPCRGMLGPWTVPAEIEENIREQLPSITFEGRQKEMRL